MTAEITVMPARRRFWQEPKATVSYRAQRITAPIAFAEAVAENARYVLALGREPDLGRLLQDQLD